MQASKGPLGYSAVLVVVLGFWSFLSPTAAAQSYVFGRADFPTGTDPVAVITGDFNRDGKLDLIVADQSANTVSVLLGKPDGTFQPKTDLPVGSLPSALAAGDFNGDGKLDLVVANSGGNTVSVLLGNGDGTFQPPVVYATGKSPHSVVVGDFNGDKKLDVAVANTADNTVSILIGNGDGTFASQVTYAAGSAPTSVITGDFNGDGKLDLVVAGAGASILLGNGDGTFGAAALIQSGPGPESVADGDLNNDGTLDLIVADSTASTATVLFGNGDGTFRYLVAYPTGTAPASVIIADFNGDGMLDFATADQAGNTISVRLQNGTPTFFNFQNPQVTYVAGPSPTALVSADFNGDGKLDLGVTSLSSALVSVLLGRGDGTFDLRNDSAIGGDLRPVSIVAADFNLDGKLDLFVPASYFTGELLTLLGNGDGTFQTPIIDTSLGGFGAAAGDFNGDGKPDIVLVLNNGSGDLSILLGNGDGTFTRAGTVSGSFGTPAVGDFNGDGKLDVVAVDTSLGANSVSVLLGNGDGTLQSPVGYAAGSGPLAVAVADFNRDGKLDLVTANNTSNTVSILLGNGDGTFRPHVDYATGSGPSAVVAGDFNNDGKADLAVANSNDATISVLLGNGDGTFQPHVDYPVPAGAALVAGDFNADGNLDLAVVNPAFGLSGITSVLLGNGDGTFRPHMDYFTPNRSVGLTTGDFNQDGAPDLAVLTSTIPENTGVSVFLNGPVVALFPTSLTFADGSASAPQTVTVSHPSAGQLKISSIKVSAGFSETNDCPASLPPAGSCTVTVTFTPTAPGTVTGALTIADNSATSPHSVALMGPAPVVSLSRTSLTFASQPAGTTSTAQTVTLTNTGSASLSITSISTTGDFSATNTCKGSVSVGASCTIPVVFKPTAAGTRTGSVTITDNALSSPQTITLSGTGTAPSVTLAPTSLSFGSELVGQGSVATAVTLTNGGTAPLTSTSITIGGTDAGDFSQQNNCGSTVAAGATCSISVTFKPTAGGIRSATLTASGNAAGSPQTAALSGTGEDFSISAASGSSTSATVTAGQTAAYSLDIASEGGLTGTVSLACSGAPAESTCAASPASVALNGAIAANPTVSVTTMGHSVTLPRPQVGPPVFTRYQHLPLALWLMELATLIALVASGRRRAWAGLAVVLTAVLLWAACGGGGSMGGGGNSGTPAGTYTLTVTGTLTSGQTTLKQNMTLTLKVN